MSLPPQGRGAGLADRLPGLLYAGATFGSAFLLFQVQPIFGKYILPWYGGSAGVWTTCMMFYTSALMVGYLEILKRLPLE